MPGVAPTGVDNNRFIYVGAKYTIHGFSVSASYGNGRNPSHADKVNLDMLSAGIGYRFTPALQVTSAVYYLKDRNVSTNKSTAVVLAADYSLSKRTMVYAQVGHVNNRGTMDQMLVYGQPVAPGVGTTAAMIGLRHTF